MNAPDVILGFIVVREDSTETPRGVRRSVRKELPRRFSSRDAAQVYATLCAKKWPSATFFVSEVRGPDFATLSDLS